MDQAIFTVGCFFASMCNTSFAVRLRNVLVSFQLKTLNKYLSGWGRKCTLLLSLKMITHSFYSKARFGLIHKSFLVLWLPGIVTCLCFCKTIPRATLASWFILWQGQTKVPGQPSTGGWISKWSADIAAAPSLQAGSNWLMRSQLLRPRGIFFLKTN